MSRLAVVHRADCSIVAISDEAICEYACEDDLLDGQPNSSILLAPAASVTQP